MNYHRLISSSEQQTGDIATKVANRAGAMMRAGDIVLIGLEGNLGMGKSVFARNFIRHLMRDHQLHVPSPTFTLVQYYDAPDGMVYHYDLYRLTEPDEIYEIGWEESLYEGVSLIEWSQRLMGMKPPQMLDISIEQADNGVDRILTLPDIFLS